MDDRLKACRPEPKQEMRKINTYDDRRVFEKGDDGWTLRVSTWSLTYKRIGSHLFQIGLVNRKPRKAHP